MVEESNLYFTSAQLTEMQNKPFNEKLQITIAKILQIINLTKGNIYVAFSGGKDSCVTLDIVAKVWANTTYKDQPLTVLFANTTCEFAGMIKHIKEYVAYIEQKYNIVIDYDMTNPDLTLKEVIIREGYPVASKGIARRVKDIRDAMRKAGLTWDDIKDHLDETVENAEWFRERGFLNSIISYLIGIKSDNTPASRKTKLSSRWFPLIWAPFEVSHKCCEFLKKEPQRKLENKYDLSPILGEMAYESDNRRYAYMRSGCVFQTTSNRYRGKPIGFWVEQDVLRYIKTYDLPIFKLYGEVKENEDGSLYLTGLKRTGCKLCLFGCGFKDCSINSLKDLEPNTCRIALKPIDEGGFGYKEVVEFLHKECKCKISME